MFFLATTHLNPLFSGVKILLIKLSQFFYINTGANIFLKYWVFNKYLPILSQYLHKAILLILFSQTETLQKIPPRPKQWKRVLQVCRKQDTMFFKFPSPGQPGPYEILMRQVIP